MRQPDRGLPGGSQMGAPPATSGAGLALRPAVPAAWGVRKSDPLLRAEMDAYLQNLKRSATWSRLVVQYFGEDALRLLGREREE